MTQRLVRRLTTILAADVAGYSRLMAEDEEGTIRRYNAARAALEGPVARFAGRVFNTAGDAVLIEFASTVNAVRCALAAQAAVAESQAAAPPERRVRFRMGLHIGDVVPQGDDLLGDGVNVAARLQQMAPAGAVVVSRAVAEQVEGKVAVALVDLGEQKVKNIPRPVRAFRLDPAAGAAGTATPAPGRRRAYALAGGAIALVLAVAAYAGRDRLAAWFGAEEPLPAGAVRDCDQCPVLMPIPAGAFLMGADDDDRDAHHDSEKPRRRVTVSRAFLIGRAEVTVAEFAAFARETGLAAARPCQSYDFRERRWVIDRGVSRDDPKFPQARDHPVVCVSWHDAEAYVAWLSRKTGKAYRLPSEAEWEYAARGGHDKPRPGTGAADHVCLHANVADRSMQSRVAADGWAYHKCDDGYAHTAPAGRFPANLFGLVDAIGNVWEWVADCYVPGYDGAPPDQRPRTTENCASRVMRGGGWISTPRDARYTMRGHNAPEFGYTATGFRVAREP